jgi:hypothetical protein
MKAAPLGAVSVPTLERFIKHAERFGVGLVFETVQAWLSDEESKRYVYAVLRTASETGSNPSMGMDVGGLTCGPFQAQ